MKKEKLIVYSGGTLLGGLIGALRGKKIGALVGGSMGLFISHMILKEKDLEDKIEERILKEEADYINPKALKKIFSFDYDKTPISEQILQGIWGTKKFPVEMLLSRRLYLGPNKDYEYYESDDEFDNISEEIEKKQEDLSILDNTLHVLQVTKNHPLGKSHYLRLMIQVQPRGGDKKEPIPVIRDYRDQLQSIVENYIEDNNIFDEISNPIRVSSGRIGLISRNQITDIDKEDNTTYLSETFEEMNEEFISETLNFNYENCDALALLTSKFRGEGARENLRELGYNSVANFVFVDIQLTTSKNMITRFHVTDAIHLIKEIMEYGFMKSNNVIVNNRKEYFLSNIIFHPGDDMDRLYIPIQTSKDNVSFSETSIVTSREYISGDENYLESEEN